MPSCMFQLDCRGSSRRPVRAKSKLPRKLTEPTGLNSVTAFRNRSGNAKKQLAVAVDAEPVGGEIREMSVPSPVGREIAVTRGRNLDVPMVRLATIEGDVPVAINNGSLEMIEAIRKLHRLDRRILALGLDLNAHAEFFCPPTSSESGP